MDLKANIKVCWITQFVLLCICFSVFACGNEISDEINALLAIKSDLVDHLGYLSDWKYNDSIMHVLHCSWIGITCNNKSRVVGLDLSRKNLTGKISQAIELLDHLVNLDISQNHFYGPISEAIFRLPKLENLYINENFFNGPLPEILLGLQNLVEFNAYRNDFVGPLPLQFSQLSKLKFLNLGGSYFSGSIPIQYGDFPSLEFLYLEGNEIIGSIPAELGKLPELRHLMIGYNSYTGGIPWQLSNLSKLEYLHIPYANLSGSLPAELGKFQNLSRLVLKNNRLTGSIPWQLSNITSLNTLDLSNNMLTGPIPEGFSRLKSLQVLNLYDNNLSGDIPKGIGDLPSLLYIAMWNNSFTGSLPEQLGRNSRLKWLVVSSNKLTGPIPPDVCAGNQLVALSLFRNQLTGEIPYNLTNCPTLNRVRIQQNKLSGHIPLGFGRLKNLSYVDMSWNNLTGYLPSDLFNSPTLGYLNVSYNPVQGSLPPNIWATPILQIFSASFANLSGNLPSFANCNFVYRFELQGNRISGSIPRNIVKCQKLVYIELSQNKLTGVIPPEMAKLPSLSVLHLSHNALTGMIPPDFQNCAPLECFNVSFNQLSGPVPSDGLFRSIDSNSFAGNPGLCGGVLAESPCVNLNDSYFTSSSYYTPDTKKIFPILWKIIWFSGVAVFILIIGKICCYNQFTGHDGGEKCRAEKHGEDQWKMTAFQELSFTIEDVLERLESAHMVGSGATGTVYRVEMPGGKVIAVKKLWRVDREESDRRRAVLAEVEILSSVRHRNIVKMLGLCSNNHDTLLLYEYMPNGSLQSLLHESREESMLPDWTTRHRIAVGVAEGLCYLHHDCRPVIVHRDVKPCNIVLDADMNAKIADFGESKLIQTDLEPMTTIAGSYGYIAPECAYTLEVQEKCDVYSFGVVLLELLTGRKAIDPEFGDATSIVEWVKGKIRAKEGISEVFDKHVVASCYSGQKELLLVLHLALLCTSRCSNNRPSMRDVVRILLVAEPSRKTKDSQSEKQQNSYCLSLESSLPSFNLA